jgi:hypothetical protein
MLRKIICAVAIVTLTIATASAQTDKPGLPGYTNILRSGQEKKDDIEIDRAYQSTRKVIPTKKETSDPWADVRPDPPATAKNKRQ